MKTKRRNIHRINKTKTLYKSISKNKTKRNSKNKTKRKQLGGDDERAEYYKKLRDYRDRFIKVFLPIISFKNKNEKNFDKKDKFFIETFIGKIKSFFENNKNLINTQIPIDEQRLPSLKNIFDYVPIPIIVMDNVTNKNIREKLIQLFYENGGNINVYSLRFLTRNDVFNYVVEKRQIDNIKMLFYGQYGLTRDSLKDENKLIFDELIKDEPSVIQEQEQVSVIQEQVSVIQEQVPVIQEQVPVIQEQEQVPLLTVPFPLPINIKLGYDSEAAPEFWKPIFDNNGTSLLQLREQIRILLSEDVYDKIIVRKDWNSCKIVERMFPKYFVKKNPDYGMDAKDFVNINTSLCSILLLLGIISYKMSGQNYNFIFKGGKAVQFVLSEIENTSKYVSDDIDILVINSEKIPYNKENMENVAEHISLLVQWFLKGTINISLEFPNTTIQTIGKDIVKISYKKMGSGYNALSDVGFGKINENIIPFFKNPKNFQIFVPELNQTLVFKCPTIDAILDEKLYYYLKFIEFKNILKTGGQIFESGYENTKEEDLNFFMKKFKRSIIAILDGLIIQEFGNIGTNETEIADNRKIMLQNVLYEFKYDNRYKEQVIQSIMNSNPYEV
ncbi:MAG: hypothetical protein NTZ51_06380 [Proteobacteria bacterium]|nr:hypothetical protein [Pseudomonadota bacterium]